MVQIHARSLLESTLRVEILHTLLAFHDVLIPGFAALYHRGLEQDNQFPFLHGLPGIAEQRAKAWDISRSRHLRPVGNAGLSHQSADRDDLPIHAAHDTVSF